MGYISFNDMKKIAEICNIPIRDYYDDNDKIVGHYIIIEEEFVTDELDEEDKKYNG